MVENKVKKMWVGQIIFFIHCGLFSFFFFFWETIHYSLSCEQFNTHFFPSCHNCPIIPIKQKTKNKIFQSLQSPNASLTSFHRIEIKLACCWTLNPFIMAFTLNMSYPSLSICIKSFWTTGKDLFQVGKPCIISHHIMII